MFVEVERIASSESLIRPRMGTTRKITYGRALISRRFTTSKNMEIDKRSGNDQKGAHDKSVLSRLVCSSTPVDPGPVVGLSQSRGALLPESLSRKLLQNTGQQLA